MSIKNFRSPDYNFTFDTKSGFFARWGNTKHNDPSFSPYGPEILDIEITDICKGPGGKPCPFCYKANTPSNTSNMSFEMFKDIIDKMPETLTQIAFGADAQCESNPDIWKMMGYARTKGIVPNITVADITDEIADKLAEYCGAVAVSRYDDKSYCYNSIKKLVDRGMKQVNIHILISEETVDQVYETFNDYVNGDIKGLNAIVLLSLKKKGRGKGFTPLSQEKFTGLVKWALLKKVPLGFDSCSCHKFLESVKDHDNYKEFKMLSEPCESSCFSSYIDCLGNFYPCSFASGNIGWVDGLAVSDYISFMDVWSHERNKQFRENLLKNDRKCPIFEV